MKKRWLKPVVSYGLIVVLTIGLSACGGRGNSNNKENVNVTLAKENVYQVNSVNISPWIPCEDGYITVRNAKLTSEGICAVLELQDRLAGKVYYGVLTADGELSNVQINTLELPEEAKEAAADEVTADNDKEKSEEKEPYENEGKAEKISYSNFVAAADKRIYGLRSCTDSVEEESIGEPREEQKTEVCCWDDSGRVLWESEIADLYEDGERGKDLDVLGIYAAGDSSLNLLLMGENIYKIHISKEGELSDKEMLSDESAAMLSDCFGIWPGEDGSVRILYPGKENREKTFLVDYLLDTDTMGEPCELSFPYVRSNINKMAAGRVSDLIFSDMDGVSVYNRGDEKETPKMNYVNSDIDITSVDALMEMDESRFAMFFREYHQGLKLGIFSHVKPEEVAERQVLVLGGSSINGTLRRQVVAFNRASDTYRIVLKEYEYDEYSHSYLQLNNDVLTGNMPDILVTAGLSDEIDNYIEKGLVADLYPLIEQDEELSKEEFMENVFEAYSVDGRLMFVVPGFRVSTMVAKTSLVGDGSGWSLCCSAD